MRKFGILDQLVKAITTILVPPLNLSRVFILRLRRILQIFVIFCGSVTITVAQH